MGLLLFELVELSDLHLGLLHRSSERILEHRRLHLSTGYWDRMDYVASYCQSYLLEHANCLAMSSSSSSTLVSTDVMLGLHRTLNHTLNLGCLYTDTGGVTPLLFYFD